MTHSRPPSFFNFTHAHPSKPTTGNNCTGNSREALLALLALQQVVQAYRAEPINLL